jgi:hypothetical protein
MGEIQYNIDGRRVPGSGQSTMRQGDVRVRQNKQRPEGAVRRGQGNTVRVPETSGRRRRRERSMRSRRGSRRDRERDRNGIRGGDRDRERRDSETGSGTTRMEIRSFVLEFGIAGKHSTFRSTWQTLHVRFRHSGRHFPC